MACLVEPRLSLTPLPSGLFRDVGPERGNSLASYSFVLLFIQKLVRISWRRPFTPRAISLSLSFLSLYLSLHRLQGGVSGFFSRPRSTKGYTEAARFLTVLVVARLAFTTNN